MAKSKVRTDGLTAPIGDLAKFRAQTLQNARDAHAAAEAGDRAGWASALLEAL